MTDFRRFPATEARQIIDYNRFIELTGEKVFICIDRGVLEIAKYLLNTRGSWRSTYVKEYLDIGYNMPTIEEFNNVTQAIAEANSDMASCDDIVTELAGIKLAIQNMECCGGNSGSRGSGTQDSPASTYDETEDFETPPPGFADWEEYRSHKCNSAQDILNALKADLLGLSGVAYAGSSPSALVGTLTVFLLTPIPFDDLISLAAYLIATGYNYTFLATISGEIETNNENLLCILYSSANAEDAKSDFLAEIETLSNAVFPNPTDATWTSSAVEYMLTYDSFNKLFESGPTIEQSADCSSCGGTEFTAYNCLYMVEGGETQSPTYLEQDAIAGGSNYIWAIGWIEADERTFTVVSGSLTASGDWPSGLQAIDDTANNCGVGNTGSWANMYSTFAQPVVNGPNVTVQFFSSTPFRMRVTITG